VLSHCVLVIGDDTQARILKHSVRLDPLVHPRNPPVLPLQPDALLGQRHVCNKLDDSYLVLRGTLTAFRGLGRGNSRRTGSRTLYAFGPLAL
jgi:hypothetical protein